MFTRSLVLPVAFACTFLATNGALAASSHASPAEFWLRLILVHTSQEARKRRLTNDQQRRNPVKITSEFPPRKRPYGSW